jgi:ribosomal protein S18 acetylase RimI-like enzyme
MVECRLREMRGDEYEEFRARLVREYAAAHVAAGDWASDGAQARAEAEMDELLPDGPHTDGSFVMTAEDEAGGRVGFIWVALKGPSSSRGAWIYDIEVDAARRGQGYGRALLAAAEAETLRRGADTIALNVFGANTVARSLYDSAGYEVTTLQMRKRFSA